MCLKEYYDDNNLCERTGCKTVEDLNAAVLNGRLRQLIRTNEALHELQFFRIVEMICCRGAKTVMIAGPSSSGKTTSANRLAERLRAHGRRPILISLDDYYIDRDKIMPGPDGTIDLEHIQTIDTELFRVQLQDLFAGKKVSLPIFNFLTGKREWQEKDICLAENAVLVVEGLHALNPMLMPEVLDKSLVFKLYVCPTQVPEPFAAAQLRLLRRIIRDHAVRGASVQQTLNMWDSVQRGERQWVFPFRERADITFNSATVYELAVLKKYIYPLVKSVDLTDDCYLKVRTILEFLNCIESADVDDKIPPASIVREFIGGSAFYK